MTRVSRIVICATLAVILAACSPETVPTVAPDAPLEGAFSCVGVPPVTCQEMLADARRNASSGVVVVQMHVRCAVVPCTLQSGTAEADIRYSDGSQSTYGMGWAGGLPGP